MILQINGSDYHVNENEYKRIPHEEYNNLKLYSDLAEQERIIGLIKKCREIKEDKCTFISTKTTHGGFIPINVSNTFDDVFMIETEEVHKINIMQNLSNKKMEHISFDFNEWREKENGFIVALSENIDDLPSIIYDYNWLAMSKSNVSSRSGEVFKMYGTDYYIHVGDKIADKFTDTFRYYIDVENKILNFDNLINLCIMVKNGGPQFEDMLTKNFSLIDRWTILDTGSTDETIEIINRILVGKKEGTLYQEPFINFRDSRNRLLDLAGNSCKFNLTLDDTYIVEGDLRSFLNEVRSDQYSNSFTLYIHSDDTKYGSNRIIKSDSGLRYIFRIHEVISDKNNINVVIPENRAFIDDKRFDYMEKRTMERKQLDLKLLYEEVEENPMEPRTYYYLAQTYSLLEEYEKAFFYFMKRCEFTNSGFIQERVDAAFEAARLANFKLNKPWDECEQLYIKAFRIDESRHESLYFIGIHYYLEGNIRIAYDYFKQAFKLGFPQHCQYSLKPTLSFHFLPKFLTRICYELEDYSLGLESSSYFIANNPQTANDYQEILSWYKIFEKLVIHKDIKEPNFHLKPILCFHADGGFNPWTGSTILTSGVGGSETYIIEMARYIQQSNLFDVYVFCNTPGEKDENFEGVNYKHLNAYYEFINNNYIHTCIVSRFSEYLPVTFKSQCENVYFVIHDILPSGCVIPMDSKLKKIFCLTEWHVEYFTSFFPQLKSITTHFYYGCNFNADNDLTNQKIPYSFIYSSFPNRGLLQLLEMWPTIYEANNSATLHIYSDVNNKWSNDVEPEKMQQIRQLLDYYSKQDNNLGIYYHGWVSKSVLKNAWKLADIWFYPCTFMETFCLTALEAAHSKTFVITNDLAALQNTVGNRGLIIKGDPATKEWQTEALKIILPYIQKNESDNTLKIIKESYINKNFQWASNLTWNNQAIRLIKEHVNKVYNIDSFFKNLFNHPINTNEIHILKIGAFTGNIQNDELFGNLSKNTKAIFVEPIPKYFYKLKENYNNKYPNNKFLYINKAVSGAVGKLQLFSPSETNNYDKLPWWIEQLASSNKDHCKNHGYDIDLDNLWVNCTTISQLIYEYKIEKLYYLIVDTEGNDYDILINTSFEKFKPKFIKFENMHMDGYKTKGDKYKKLIKHLTNYNYKIIYEGEEDTILFNE